MGIVDAAGIGLGGGFGGWGGALEGNFAGDAVTLFADMKEQDMAQVSGRHESKSEKPIWSCSSFTSHGQLSVGFARSTDLRCCLHRGREVAAPVLDLWRS